MEIEEIEIKTVEDVIENDVFNKLENLPLVLNGMLIYKRGMQDGKHVYQHKIFDGNYVTITYDNNGGDINQDMKIMVYSFEKSVNKNKEEKLNEKI